MHPVTPAPTTPATETFHFAEGLQLTVSADDESLVDCNYWRTHLPSRDEVFLWIGLLKAHLFLPREIANTITRVDDSTFRLAKPDAAGVRVLTSDRHHKFPLAPHQHAGAELDSMFRVLEVHRRTPEGNRIRLAVAVLKRG